MNFFKDLIEADVYDTTNFIHTESMKFVFTTLLQREVDVTCDTWSSHRIRNKIPPMQQSFQLDDQTSFILNIVKTIYIQLIIKHCVAI